MKLLASLITTILHPLVLALTAVYLIVFQETGDSRTAFLWTCISIIFAGIIAGFVLFGIKKGFFTNIDVSVRKQRIILYPFAAVVMAFFSFLIYSLKGPVSLFVGIIFFILALLVLDVINKKIKASIHVATVTALAVGLIEMFGVLFMPCLITIPLVAWARVLEKRHTVKETIAGGIAGSTLSIIGIFVVEYIIGTLK